MKKMIEYLKEKKGLTLVETLTALTILTLIIFCFAPLFLSYLNNIKASGEKMQHIYSEVGVLQSLLGNKGSGANSGYESNVSDIPLIFTAPGTSVTRNGVTQSVPQTSVAVGRDLDRVGGNFIFSNPNDIKNGFTAMYTDSINSNIKCFPSSLTDDFKMAYITVVADGFTFSNDHMNDYMAYALYCTKANALNTGSELKQLIYGKDYSLERVEGTQNMLLLTLYGGTDVSFENSPLVFKYNNGAYVKEIEVDAPMMVMVGEKATDGKYYYYVSRGEVDDNGNLIMLRRTMNSKDAKTGENITLNSAMNDVEWVPADSGDGHNVDGNNDKYGYYVMCGDNGQIRRFWRNNATGNYYWGGDYTYYTDIILDRHDGPMYYNGTETYGTGVSYKYANRRTHGKEGFILSESGSQELQSANIWSVTAFGNNAGVQPTYYFGSDGKLVYYRTKSGATPVPVYSLAYDTGNQSDSLLAKYNGNESQSWLIGNDDGYYKLNGLDKSTTIPITLTCVDAIQLSGSGGGYYNDVKKNSYEFSLGAATNMNYPTQSYTLYCGFIPAAMDAWTKSTGFELEPYYKSANSVSDSNYKNINLSTKMDRVLPNIGNIDGYTKWRGNFGMVPYLTRPNLLTKEYTLEVQGVGTRAFYKNNSLTAWKEKHEYIDFYPYENLEYAVTGKFYDEHTSKDINGVFYPELMPRLIYSRIYDKQGYMTNGKAVDVTLSYLSHPFATHIAANPNDDNLYDLSNDKVDIIYYWNNLRETVTFLDCASTVIPNGDKDIPVSLMVGYIMGGTVEFQGADAYVNSMMNNGIVFLRAGSAEIKRRHENSITADKGEYYTVDKNGYKLDTESNVFHQFYYLNSRTTSSQNPSESAVKKHIGNVYGAHYWQNNRHIETYSLDGGEPGSDYNYLRCHPLSDTKVNCVGWGNTWNNSPEAMWGTENGTILSWFVDLQKASTESDASYWNDRSVMAELQSYRWIDNVDNKTYKEKSSDWKDTIGSAVYASKSSAGTPFSPANDSYTEFYDKCSRVLNNHKTIGVISVLNSVNDVAYDNNVWVAVGDQSNKNPADYCATGSAVYGGETVKAYTGDGKGGSWCYVRYWVDVQNIGYQSESNNNYLWKSVKISDKPYCNFVQINNINGIWVATGYIDANRNGEQDDGEKTVVSWASDPLSPVGTENGWSDKVIFLETTSHGTFTDVSLTVGGINSVATRS